MKRLEKSIRRAKVFGSKACDELGPRGVAGMTPVLVGANIERLGVGNAIGLYVACAYGSVLIAAIGAPEARGRTLLEV